MSSTDHLAAGAETTPLADHQAHPVSTAETRLIRSIGVLLCLAAGLKLFDLFDSYGEDPGWSVSLIASTFELLVGVALTAGVWPSVVVPVGGLLFLMLTAVAIIGTARGASRCGCLGAVPLPPWIPMIVDAAAAAVLLRAPRSRLPRQFVWLDGACILAFLVGTTIGSASYPTFLAVTRNISEELIADAKFFEINPSRFRGQPFFLRRFIRIDADLSRGRWKVILTKPGCRKCDRMLRGAGGRPEGDEQVAVVVARGPRPADQQWTLPEGCQAVLGELSPKKTWDFKPPLTFHLTDGKVTAVE